jgi:hypothetical protein
MSQFLETTVRHFRTTRIMPSGPPAIPAADSHSVDDPAEFMPAMHSVADVADEASSEIMAPALDTNSLPAQDDMTSADPTPSLPSGGVFASDRMFVRENPW